MGAPKNQEVDTFPDPVGHFGFCRWCGIAGGERVTLAQLGWYLHTAAVCVAVPHF